MSNGLETLRLYAHICSHPVIASVDLLSNYETTTQIAGIEDLIAQGVSMHIVLRLLCLASIVTGGIRTKTLEALKREILQVSAIACGLVGD